MKEVFIAKNIFSDPSKVESRICELEQYLQYFPDGLIADCARKELAYQKELYALIA